MKHPLSIQDIVMITGKSKTTIFRYIKKGKLKSETQVTQGNTTYFVEKEELERFLNREVTPGNTPHVTPSDTQVTPGITPENIQSIVKDTIDKTITQMARPMEEQALFIAGKLSTENQFLKERLDTLRQENDLLREQVKALPDFQREQDTLKVQVGALEREKADLLSRGETIQKEQEEKHRSELEELKKSMEEARRQELEQAREQAEEEGKNYLATIEELKKRLEAEEKRPWYRRLFS